MAKKIIGADDFIEIFVDAPVEICIERDPKGLYKKALSGEIKNFTGVSAPFDRPDNADVTVNTAELSIEEGIGKALEYVLEKVKKD